MDRQLRYAERAGTEQSARKRPERRIVTRRRAGALLATKPERNQMSGKLGGKIALVTGGTAGICLATAQRFVKEGAYVFVTGLGQTELELAAMILSAHVTVF